MRYDYIDTIDRYHKLSWRVKGAVELNFQSKKFYHEDTYLDEKMRVACDCCRTVRSIYEYPLRPKNSFFMGNKIHDKKDENVIREVRGVVCVHCLVKMYENQVQEYNMDPYQALYSVCAMTNHYYDDNLAHRIYTDIDREYKDPIKPVPDSVHWVDLYFREVYKSEENSKKDFWNSENFQFDRILIAAANNRPKTDDLLSKEDKDNYNTILNTFHYDPFEDVEPRLKIKYMSWLVTMIDDAMNGDFVRMQAAIEVVRAFGRMDDLDKQIKILQNDGPNGVIAHAGDIKRLTEIKNKEAAMVTQFSKDNGFAEKYAMSKSKGSGTMSAIVRDMKNAHYDFGTINKYDIETANAIKQVSDISAESIFKQIGFSDSDYARMVKEQAEVIINLKNELSSKTEELRMFKEKELKQELLEELKDELISKGIPTENVDEIISRELNKNRGNQEE